MTRFETIMESERQGDKMTKTNRKTIHVDDSGKGHDQERNNEMSMENKRMRRGQKLVLAGFGIAIVGILLYCLAAFSAGFGQDEPIFVTESLAIVGLGTLVWVIGAVQYLNGAIDSNAADDDLL